jgi:site-specific DNA-cytosine methylase
VCAGGGLADGTTLVKQEERIRKLTPIECERLQALPDNYTEGIAMTNRYKCLGNAFNVDVVAHILGRVKLMY